MRSYRSLYEGMSQQPVTYQHLEEFLITAGAKDKVTLDLNREEANFYEVSESIQESFLYSQKRLGAICVQILK